MEPLNDTYCFYTSYSFDRVGISVPKISPLTGDILTSSIANSFDESLTAVSSVSRPKYDSVSQTVLCSYENNSKGYVKSVIFSTYSEEFIENETLDDLVKISGVTANIDETSRLAMEGKIDIRTTLSLRVNYLKKLRVFFLIQKFLQALY